MIKETDKKLENDDRMDMNLAITARNVALEYLNSVTFADKIAQFENLTEEELKNYFSGICDAYVEAEITLHSLRKEFSKKYDIPYDFVSSDGDISLVED